MRTAFFIMLLTSSLMGQSTGQWATVDPGAGSIQALAADPSNALVLYAGTRECGIHKSEDGGVTWFPVNNGLDQPWIQALAVDPFNADIVYATVGRFTVEEGGITRLFKTTNGAKSWYPINSVLPLNTNYPGIVMDPSLKNTFYVYSDSGPGNKGRGVYKTFNGGATWFHASYGLGDLNVLYLTIDVFDTDVLYAGTYQGGIFKTTDAGTSWFERNLGLPDHASVTSIALSPSSSDTLYAAAEGSLYSSTDAGNEWSALTDPAGLTAIIAVDPSDSTLLYAGTVDAGMFRSADSGANWSWISNGLTSPAILSLIFSPSTAGTLFLGADGAGVFKTTNSGNLWSAFSTGIPCSTAPALALDPRTQGTLYAGLAGGRMMKSFTGGETWISIQSGLAAFPEIRDLAVDPATTSTLYTALFEDGVFKSLDSGGSWFEVNSGLIDLDLRILAIDAQPEVVYAATRRKIYRTLNGGLGWTLSSAGLPGNSTVLALVTDPLTPGEVYASMEDHGVYRSRTSGDTWFFHGIGLPVDSSVNALAIDPEDSDILYAHEAVKGLYKTKDGGELWFDLLDNLPEDTFITTLTVDPVTPDRIYAGTEESGVYVSNDTGGHWSAVNAGLPQEASSGAFPLVLELAAENVQDGSVYIGTQGRGLYRADYFKDDSGDSGSSGSTWICFFGTVAQGSFLSAHLQPMRAFRDDRLLACSFGTALVRLYYDLSPPVAEFVGRRPALRCVLQWATAPLFLGIAYPWTATGLMAISWAGWIAWRRRKKKKPRSSAERGL